MISNRINNWVHNFSGWCFQGELYFYVSQFISDFLTWCELIIYWWLLLVVIIYVFFFQIAYYRLSHFVMLEHYYNNALIMYCLEMKEFPSCFQSEYDGGSPVVWLVSNLNMMGFPIMSNQNMMGVPQLCDLCLI
jgi:hypothetical protein